MRQSTDKALSCLNPAAQIRAVSCAGNVPNPALASPAVQSDGRNHGVRAFLHTPRLQLRDGCERIDNRFLTLVCVEALKSAEMRLLK